jgi:hypothetical protein
LLFLLREQRLLFIVVQWDEGPKATRLTQMPDYDWRMTGLVGNQQSFVAQKNLEGSVFSLEYLDQVRFG